jgi:ABC-2 type transport system ATP-binding protein
LESQRGHGDARAAKAFLYARKESKLMSRNQAVIVSHLAKSFGSTQAVVDVSFAVERGEIFGLLGPNGAGKTTTIRVALGIFKPDQGAVSILGGHGAAAARTESSEARMERIGYMPEERGLYQDISLEKCLVYLAILKGLPRAEARRRVGAYLERFDLASHRARKVKELSKGMQQKAQIIAAIVHAPELILIDEPFTALDPVNTLMVKDLMRELRDQGATILMSTHQMHQVEELCDRIVLIDHGRNVLYGGLDAIRRRYAGEALLVHTAAPLPPLPGVTQVVRHNGDLKLTLSRGTAPQAVLEALVAQHVPLEKFEIALPTLDEIFVQVVAGRPERAA